MGYIGYYMKKGEWWGYLILLPMIGITASSYATYFRDFQFYFPRFILISLFCAAAMILYPVAIFDNKKIKAAGAVVGGIAVVLITIWCLRDPFVYTVELISISDELKVDESFKASFDDERYGDVKVIYGNL